MTDPGPKSTWMTEERIADMTERWKRGESASTIATLYGTTRNAVMGKLTRMGLTKNPGWKHHPLAQKIRAAAKRSHASFVFTKRRRPWRDEPSEPTELDNDTVPSPLITLDELTSRTCRWPIGDPLSPEFRFCGRRQADLNGNHPYCHAHERMAWQQRSR